MVHDKRLRSRKPANIQRYGETAKILEDFYVVPPGGGKTRLRFNATLVKCKNRYLKIREELT